MFNMSNMGRYMIKHYRREAPKIFFIGKNKGKFLPTAAYQEEGEGGSKGGGFGGPPPPPYGRHEAPKKNIKGQVNPHTRRTGR